MHTLSPAKSMKQSITLLTVLLMTTASLAQTPATAPQPFKDMYGVFVSNKLTATKQFYVSTFGMSVAFESTIFLILISPGDKPFTVGFMPENHPFVKPRLKAYSGGGSYLTIEVADVETLYKTFVARKVPITYPLKKEDWGQIRFAMLDPNGIWVDVIQTIEPKPGYYDQYIPK